MSVKNLDNVKKMNVKIYFHFRRKKIIYSELPNDF